nr:four-helix bundle copper-binding protein [Phytohalomonas tamaricis]
MVPEQYAACIEACNNCADFCDTCTSSCLGESNVAHMADCIRLNIDCSQICRLAASYMARDSQNAKQLCALCADICQQCGDECSQHEAEHCQKCAEACHRCAEACRRMVA